MELHIPDELHETLKQNDALVGLVYSAVDELGAWLARNDVR